MRLLLMRHGIAEDAGPATGWRDEPRALTEEGRARMVVAARGVARLGEPIEAVITSPLVRCVQTGGIVADVVGVSPSSDRRLRPGADHDAVCGLLLEHPDARGLLLCGHQPDMSRLVGAFTGGLVEFRRGTLAVLELADATATRGHLRDLYPPAALRLMGAGG